MDYIVHPQFLIQQQPNDKFAFSTWAPCKVPMGEDALKNGRPANGVYFLTTNGEEPRSYNSYEQWIEN